MMKYLVQAFLSSCLVSMALARPDYATGKYLYHGPAAPIGHDGRVVDTPEVAHAKAAHFAALHEAASKASYELPHEGASHGIYSADHLGTVTPAIYSSKIQHHGYGYHGPPAPLDHDGRVIDTPEVAHAKAAHFAAYREATSHLAYAPVAVAPIADYSAHEHGYHRPAAPLGKDGRVVDTPEVAHAKAAHLAAFAHASPGHFLNNYHSY